MFEQEIEMEKKTSSIVPLLLIVSLIVAVVGVSIYFVIQSRKVLTTAEANSVVTRILDGQGPITLHFQTGIVKAVDKPRDPHYRLLEKAGYVKIGKDSSDYKTPVSLTPKGEALLAELAGAKKSKNNNGNEEYAVPLASRKLVEINKVTMLTPSKATVEYTWKWETNKAGEMFDAAGPAVGGAVVVDEDHGEPVQPEPPGHRDGFGVAALVEFAVADQHDDPWLGPPLRAKAERQEKRLERDLALARELQFRLLPPTAPKLANLEVAARSISARQIGGDFYDFLNYSTGRTAFVIGDVSGKGAPAAIYAALVSGILRSHAPMEPGAAEMLSAVNLSLGERRIEAQFVSIICAVWDDQRRTLLLANSGLPRPVFCRNGKAQIIEATGLPLGLFEEADYDEFTFQAKPGDLFVFFSDGILDAATKSGELFGRERVEAIVAASGQKSAQQVVDAIGKAVADYSAAGDAFDDQTIVVLKVKDANAKPDAKK